MLWWDVHQNEITVKDPSGAPKKHRVHKTWSEKNWENISPNFAITMDISWFLTLLLPLFPFYWVSESHELQEIAKKIHQNVHSISRNHNIATTLECWRNQKDSTDSCSFRTSVVRSTTISWCGGRSETREVSSWSWTQRRQSMWNGDQFFEVAWWQQHGRSTRTYYTRRSQPSTLLSPRRKDSTVDSSGSQSLLRTVPASDTPTTLLLI